MQRSSSRRLVAMVSDDGYRIEQILVQRSLRRPPRPMLRISWRNFHVADVASVGEIAQFVDLATLRAVES